MGFLPYDAPAPRERSFETIARVTTDEIIRLGDAVGKPGRLRELPKSKDGRTANPDSPYWDFVLEQLDAKFASDGNPLMLVLSNKLTDINGEWLDSEQRHYLTATAFAGLGVRVAPLTQEVATRFAQYGFDMGVDPSYDAAEVIGRTFRLKSQVMKDRTGKPLGRDLYLPVEAFAADYTYTGQVRLVQANRDQSGVGVDANGTVAAAANVIDIATNAEARQAVANAIAGSPADDDAVMAVLRASNLGTYSLSGTRFLELFSDDKLVTSLAEAGIVGIENGQLTAVTA
jgi:hypothetical protein